jgi:sugar phosphate isomerase/epimerase
VTIRLGADSLCWHLRLERGHLSPGKMLEEAAEAGASHVQLNLHHVRRLSNDQLSDLAQRAEILGLRLLASGDFVGAARHGDQVETGANRISGWLDGAAALGSPVLRLVSGFYRTDLADRPDLIALEQAYVVDVLRASVARAQSSGIRLLLENHSDFNVTEYLGILDAVSPAATGVFLDLINPVSMLQDPRPVVTALAPHAYAGHAKDYRFESIPTDDGYHRRGFSVLYRYPGEGVAPHAALLQALKEGVGTREFYLGIEGLDNRHDVADQTERLRASLRFLGELIA